jgi:hypothetical protein
MSGSFIQQMLVKRFSSTCLNMHFHINCWCTSPSSMVYCWRANSAGFPDVMINGMKHVWVQKSTLRIPLPTQPYSCCTITMGFAENLVHTGVFLECTVVHLKHTLIKLLQYWKNSSILVNVNRNKYPVVRPTWALKPGLTDGLVVGLKKKAFDCMYSSLETNAWYHILVYMV